LAAAARIALSVAACICRDALLVRTHVKVLSRRLQQHVQEDGADVANNGAAHNNAAHGNFILARGKLRPRELS